MAVHAPTLVVNIGCTSGYDRTHQLLYSGPQVIDSVDGFFMMRDFAPWVYRLWVQAPENILDSSLPESNIPVPSVKNLLRSTSYYISLTFVIARLLNLRLHQPCL
jgi:hypothetical protein